MYKQNRKIREQIVKDTSKLFGEIKSGEVILILKSYAITVNHLGDLRKSVINLTNNKLKFIQKRLLSKVKSSYNIDGEFNGLFLLKLNKDFSKYDELIRTLNACSFKVGKIVTNKFIIDDVSLRDFASSYFVISQLVDSVAFTFNKVS